jgi:hypothetical protein
MNNWRKFRQLPEPEQSVLLAALVLLPAVRVGLHTLGFRRVLALLDRCHGAHTVVRASASDLSIVASLSDANLAYRTRRTARLVAVAAGYAGGTCLAHSLVLMRLLERQGIPAQLRIGVRKGENGFEAHAWVESRGTVLNDGSDVSDRFAAFDRNFALARGNWQ